MRKLLQGHLDQRSPGEAAGPVADGVERSERRVHERAMETIFGTVEVERLGYARAGHESLHPLPASHRERRGARLTRREEGAYWAYATDEQRSHGSRERLKPGEHSKRMATVAAVYAVAPFAQRGGIPAELDAPTAGGQDQEGDRIAARMQRGLSPRAASVPSGRSATANRAGGSRKARCGVRRRRPLLARHPQGQRTAVAACSRDARRP